VTSKAHAVVTGTSSGIGEAIARRLLDDGWRVTGFDVAPSSIREAAFHAVSVDLTDTQARRDAIDATHDVTALVHAAGIMRGGRLGSLDLGANDLLWRVHVDAAIALADRLAPRLTEGGRIVLIGSRAARGVANRSQYGATKAALVSLARSWARELAPRGITVNVVAPAATDTAMLADSGRSTVPPVTPPIGRLIRPEEVAALVAYLLSADAAAITGQEIAICGGASL
jgi:NAD(P)-dependent dehydrogenase (short-subunit alcohol dehydrogenase family)